MPESASSEAAAFPSSSLLLQLKAQDPQAWQRFLRLYGPLVYSWCRARWRLPAADAADVLQEVVTRVMEAVADYRGGNFIAWLYTLTRSRVANHFRHNPAPAAGGSDAQQLLAEIPDPRAESEPAESPPGLEQLGGVLQRAVAAVRQRSAASSWQAFWQVTVEGRQPADVAGDLGMSVNAVYIAVSRTLHRLREELGALEEGAAS
jgi:RNA polymerase sigma-70 factor (ECF subfamily)